MTEFLAEGLREAPIALGALVGFAIGGIGVAVGVWRERRRDRRQNENGEN